MRRTCQQHSKIARVNIVRAKTIILSNKERYNKPINTQSKEKSSNSSKTGHKVVGIGQPHALPLPPPTTTIFRAKMFYVMKHFKPYPHSLGYKIV